MMMESTVDMPPPPSLEKETKVLPTTESDLRDKLDTLILEYLNLIDTYQTLQSQINNSFSSGFINIAKANFESTRRYDQNSYDERMKATKCLSIENNAEDIVKFEIKPVNLNIGSVSETVITPEAVNLQEGLRQRKSAVVDQNMKEAAISQTDKKSELDLVSTAEDHDDSEDSHADDSKKSQNDPLRWFGILVPSALRVAQTSFSTVLPMLVEKVSIINNLNELETRIGIARDQLVESNT